MNDKQRLREIEEVLTVILQEQEGLKAELAWLRAERDQAEERLKRLERVAEAHYQDNYQFMPFAAAEDMQLLQAERLLLLLTQPQTQN